MARVAGWWAAAQARTVVAACLILVAGACAGSDEDGADTTTSTSLAPTTSTTSPTVPWPTHGWPASTPEEQGIDSGLLADLVDQIVTDEGIDSVMVVRNGHVVLDTTIYPFPDDTGHAMYSVTKSVIGTLVGIAIDRGLLAGVDVPVVDLLEEAAPENVEAGKVAMTVEHVLTMATGLDCRDSALYGYQGFPDLVSSDDWAAHVLALPMTEDPGTRFEYCNGASHLLSEIITAVTGAPASEFAQDVLFAPLGITDVRWPANADGVTVGFSELVIEPSDAAKIGYLYLREGEWDGDQVVSRAWVEAATTAHAYGGVVGRYGYQWWADAAGVSVTARGAGGQFIHVVPKLDLVVVFTAGLPQNQEGRPIELMQRYVLLAAKPDPLPPNPDGLARLEAAIEAARTGPRPSPVTWPDMAESIDGARFEFGPDESPLEWFTLAFDDESARLTIEGLAPDIDGYEVAVIGFEPVEGPVEFEIGVNGRFVVGDLYGLPTAWRGRWVADDTFVVEFQVLGRTSDRGTFEFTFGDDTAELRFRNLSGVPLVSTAVRAI